MARSLCPIKLVFEEQFIKFAPLFKIIPLLFSIFIYIILYFLRLLSFYKMAKNNFTLYWDKPASAYKTVMYVNMARFSCDIMSLLNYRKDIFKIYI